MELLPRRSLDDRPLFNINGVIYANRTADGHECNCLIHSLEQVIASHGVPLESAPAAIRTHLRERFSHASGDAWVGVQNFLTFHIHTMAIIEEIGTLARELGVSNSDRITPHAYTVRCMRRISRTEANEGAMVPAGQDQYVLADEIGTGDLTLYLRNIDNIHFEPLLPLRN